MLIGARENNLPPEYIAGGCILAADIGYCSEENLAYLHEHEINAVIPDNQFR